MSTGDNFDHVSVSATSMLDGICNLTMIQLLYFSYVFLQYIFLHVGK